MDARDGGVGSGERGLNGDGVCAVMRPFDNEGKRGGKRRALDERVYTFVCIHQWIRQRLAGGKRVYGGPGRPSVQGGWYHLGKGKDSGVIKSYNTNVSPSSV